MTIALTLERLGVDMPTGSARIALDIRRNHTGDTKLWHDLRCSHLRWLYSLRADLIVTTEQLAPVDEASSHDEILDEGVLVEIGDFSKDGVHASLTHAVTLCEQSVLHMQGAYDLLAGLFKGEMRDATEESLGRSLKGAKAQLAKLQAAQYQYRLPKRPHEIRRNALSHLVVSCGKILVGLTELADSCEGTADKHLMQVFKECCSELSAFKSHLELLRERCSQKMTANLEASVEPLDALILRLESLTVEAGSRCGRS